MHATHRLWFGVFKRKVVNCYSDKHLPTGSRQQCTGLVRHVSVPAGRDQLAAEWRQVRLSARWRSRPGRIWLRGQSPIPHPPWFWKSGSRFHNAVSITNNCHFEMTEFHFVSFFFIPSPFCYQMVKREQTWSLDIQNWKPKWRRHWITRKQSTRYRQANVPIATCQGTAGHSKRPRTLGEAMETLAAPFCTWIFFFFILFKIHFLFCLLMTLCLPQVTVTLLNERILARKVDICSAHPPLNAWIIRRDFAASASRPSSGMDRTA